MVAALRPVALADVLPVHAERITTPSALPLWRGMLHALVGEGESGKTWIAAHAALDVATRGPVLVLDGEMSAPSWRRRLETLGADHHHLSQVFYAEIAPEAADVATVRPIVDQIGAVLIVWDSALSLISRTARSENDNAEVSRVYDRLRGIVRNGPAGLIVDHSARGSGSLVSRGATAKFNSLDLSYGVRLAPDSIPTPAAEWSTCITVEKDRHGLLGDRHDLAASFHPLAAGRTQLEMVEALSSSHRLSEGDPARVMAAKIAALDPPPTSATDAYRRIGGRKQTVMAAFRQWQEESA